MTGCEKTPYAVVCEKHGQQFLSEAQYREQLSRPNAVWVCPKDGEPAWFDDENAEDFGL